MTTPLTPPPKKNPQKRSLTPTSPPGVRSRATLGLTAAILSVLPLLADLGTLLGPARGLPETLGGVGLVGLLIVLAPWSYLLVEDAV